MIRHNRPWIVQLTRITPDGIKKVTDPERITSDLADPHEVGKVLLDGWIAEHAGETLGLDELRAWVWHPSDHERDAPPLITVGPIKTTYTWNEIARHRQIPVTHLIKRAWTLDPRFRLQDDTGVTADGYAWLMLAATP